MIYVVEDKLVKFEQIQQNLEFYIKDMKVFPDKNKGLLS